LALFGFDLCYNLYIMDKDFVKEKIGYYKALVTLLWTTTFVIGSGVSWSLINLNLWKQSIVTTGLISEIILVFSIIFFDNRIRKRLKELNK